MCTSYWCQENQFYLNYWTFSVDVSKASQTPHSENLAQEPLRSPLVPSSISLWQWKSLSRVQLFATLWTIARQPPLSMGFSRQEYWSGLPFPSPGDLPDPGIELGFSALQAEPLPSEPPGNSISVSGTLFTSSPGEGGSPGSPLFLTTPYSNTSLLLPNLPLEHLSRHHGHLSIPTSITLVQATTIYAQVPFLPMWSPCPSALET